MATGHTSPDSMTSLFAVPLQAVNEVELVSSSENLLRMNWLVALKVPALATATIAGYVNCSAPNPPPSKQGAAKVDPWDHTFTVVKSAIPVMLFAGSIQFCEIAVILAQQADTPLSAAILRTLWLRPTTPNTLSTTPLFLAGVVMMVCGAALRKVCYQTLGRYFTYQLAILKDHKLVTWGPYSLVRHPSYTGFFSTSIGLLLTEFAPGGWLRESGVLDASWGKAVMGAWAANVMIVMFLVLKRVPKEDAMMKREFGEEWERWARKTPYALIPYVY
ncbi:ICMT-domain-containing protein [Trametes sanguinea]|nr:ICMT-domain-containing protein [Trametes sanguinea]